MHVFTTRAYKLFMQGDHFDMGHIRLDKISVKIFNIYILSTVLRSNLKAFFMLCFLYLPQIGFLFGGICFPF